MQWSLSFYYVLIVQGISKQFYNQGIMKTGTFKLNEKKYGKALNKINKLDI